MYIGIIAFFFHLCLVGWYGVRGLSYNNTNDSDLLAILLELHVQHCGDAVMCHETNDTIIETSTTAFPQPCCIPCSCQPSCVAEQNCCPSVNILPKTSDQSTINQSHAAQDSPFYTKNKVPQIQKREISETTILTNKYESKSNDTKLAFDDSFTFTNGYEQIKITPNQGVGTNNADSSSNFKPKNNDSINTEILLKTVCVRPQLFYKPNSYPDSEAFEMVFYCPPDFEDALVAEKCRKGDKNENIADVIPVTSKVSGLTYINKHCLFCNEKNSTRIFEEWQIQIIDEKSVYYHQTYLHPQSLKEMDPIHYYNVNFVPRNPESVKKCILYDVNVCNQTGYWETYNETIRTICHYGNDLPIISNVDYNTMVFKNIACVYCNLPQWTVNSQLICGFMEGATLDERKALTVNFHYLPDNIETENISFDVAYIKNSIAQTLDIDSCPQGFAAVLGRCRKLFCPRDHYIDKGKCVPLYTRISGFGFNFRIKITPLQDIQGVNIRKVAVALLSALNNTLEKYFPLQHYETTVWYLTKDKVKIVRYYLFDIKIDNAKREFHFSQTVQVFYNFYNEFKSMDSVRHASGNKFGFQIGLGHGIDISRRKELYPVNQGDGNLRVLIEGNHEGPQKNYLTLTDINWCIRTELFSSEVELLGKTAARVNLTGTLLFNDQYDIELLSGFSNICLYTCVDYLVEDSVKQSKDRQTIPSIVKESEGSIVRDKSLSLDKGIITLSAIIAITVVCVVVFKVKTCAMRRKFLSTDHTQEDAGSISDLSNGNGVSEEHCVKISSEDASAKGGVAPTEPNENNQNIQ